MENTQRVIDFVVKTRFEDIPAKGLEQARIGIFDCVGVALAGARQPAGAIGAEWARKAGGAQQATVWGQGFKTSAHDAALVNGTAAHALDYDDVTWGLIGHPSVSLVPSVFALGEQINASGRDVLLAYAVGFEVMAKLGRTRSLRIRSKAAGTPPAPSAPSAPRPPAASCSALMPTRLGARSASSIR